MIKGFLQVTGLVAVGAFAMGFGMNWVDTNVLAEADADLRIVTSEAIKAGTSVEEAVDKLKTQKYHEWADRLLLANSIKELDQLFEIARKR